MGLQFKFIKKGKSIKDPLDGFTEVLEDYAIGARVGGFNGCEEAAWEVLDMADRLVPVDTGKLRNSWFLEQDGNAFKISYEAIEPWANASNGIYNYAWRIHEDLSLNHPNGGQAKFLEQPLREHHNYLLSIIKENVKKAFKAVDKGSISETTDTSSHKGNKRSRSANKASKLLNKRRR